MAEDIVMTQFTKVALTLQDAEGTIIENRSFETMYERACPDTAQSGSGAMLCTPDDFPILNYLRYFKCGLYFPTAPTSSKLTIRVLLKR